MAQIEILVKQQTISQELGLAVHVIAWRGHPWKPSACVLCFWKKSCSVKAEAGVIWMYSEVPFGISNKPVVLLSETVLVYELGDILFHRRSHSRGKRVQTKERFPILPLPQWYLMENRFSWDSECGDSNLQKHISYVAEGSIRDHHLTHGCPRNLAAHTSYALAFPG